MKGSLINETYAIFAAWDFGRTKTENIERVREENFIGATSSKWLVDVTKVFRRRFEPGGRDRALVDLAKQGCALEEWKPLLLWHMTRDEFLLGDFLKNWLFPAFDAGAFRVRPQELRAYLLALPEHGGTTEHAWSERTLDRTASGLLTMARDFDLLRGSARKQLITYHLPERSFLYLLHAIREEQQSPRKVIDATDWRMFLMHPADVERELLRLHQFRKLDYQVAGSLVELTLPFTTAREYAGTWTA